MTLNTSKCNCLTSLHFKGIMGQLCSLLQKMCSDQWRPSRVESECIMGDGVTFYYPDVECSPFLGRPTGIRHKYRHAACTVRGNLHSYKSKSRYKKI